MAVIALLLFCWQLAVPDTVFGHQAMLCVKQLPGHLEYTLYLNSGLKWHPAGLLQSCFKTANQYA
jgi:hypothetical protein